MSKIVLLTGSPRAKGNSMAMAKAFEDAAVAKGHEVIRFDTAKMEMNGCKACNACYRKGACALVPDFNPIAEAIEEADGIVWAAPVYWYTWPAQIKAVLDHFYAFCVAEKCFGGKKTALISCCEEADMSTFDGIVYSFEKSMGLMQYDIVGKILIPAVNEAGEIAGTDGEAQAAALADKF